MNDPLESSTLRLLRRVNHCCARSRWHLMALAMVQSWSGERQRRAQRSGRRRFNWHLIAVRF